MFLTIQIILITNLNLKTTRYIFQHYFHGLTLQKYQSLKKERKKIQKGEKSGKNTGGTKT